ncbi:MAG: NAD(+)/NADH kinase [Deltaproteobacteria bacterium]|nr:NAD(+)/NADH kinase [Deltaproteobacteria bacterium]
MATTIGVVCKPHTTDAVGIAELLLSIVPHARLLVEREGPHALENHNTAYIGVDRTEFEQASDLVVAFGGDGTLIHAASLLTQRVVPVLGVNLGRVGFLAEVLRAELNSLLPRALAGELPYTDRLRLDAKIIRNGAVRLQKRILNDAVVAQLALSRVALYRVNLNDELVTVLRGDGVIIATPTGSTAYSMAAGGSILAPDIAAIALTPICPHALSQRPLVLPIDGIIKVFLDSDSKVFVTLDGQFGQEFQSGDILEITAAPIPLRLLHMPGRSYFEILRKKLSWGES